MVDITFAFMFADSYICCPSQKLEKMEKIKKPKSSNNKSLKVMKKGDYIDISELSSMIKVSKSHLYYLTSKKLIPHIKVFGKKVLFNINDIENWLESKKVFVK